MRWGHDFPKDKGVGMLTLSQFGEKPCVVGGTHQNCQLPYFLSSLPNHLFCQKVVEVVIVVLLCCSVVLNYRVYETLLLVF